MKPLIGISADLADARWDSWSRPAYVLTIPLPQSVGHVGGAPVILPPGVVEIQELLSRLDGVIISGGKDVDPIHYGEEKHPKTRTAKGDRDVWELELARAALQTDIPVLGICRGSQILNVAAGGTLYQHVPDLSSEVSHRPEDPAFVDHWITTKADSKVQSLLGERALVASHHHQAVAMLGKNAVATAWADDGVIEAIEFEDHPWALGIQSHPEESEDSEMIRELVVQARISRGSIRTRT